MSGIRAGVLDSNILIYCSKGQLDFPKITMQYSQLYVSIITYMEVLGFPFADLEEKGLIEKILNALTIIQTDMEIADYVISYRQNKKIKIPDAIILATAKKMNAEVITVNEKDFVGVDTDVNVFSPLVR